LPRRGTAVSSYTGILDLLNLLVNPEAAGGGQILLSGSDSATLSFRFSYVQFGLSKQSPGSGRLRG